MKVAPVADLPELRARGQTPVLQLGRSGVGAATAPAAALGSLGDEITRLGERHLLYQQNVRRANFVGTRFAGLSEAAVRVEQEARKNAKPDGTGYVDAVLAAFEAERSKALKDAPDADARFELDSRVTVLKAEIARRALAEADRMMTDFTLRQVERAAESHAVAVAASPSMLDGALDELAAQLAATRGVLPEATVEEAARKARAMIVGSAIQTRVTADDLDGADAMLADPRYVESLTPKQVLALKQDIVQRRRQLRERAEMEARQRRIEARQAAQDMGAAIGVELAGRLDIDEVAAIQALGERLGENPIARASAVSAFVQMRNSLATARNREQAEATERALYMVAQGASADDAIRENPGMDPRVMLQLQESRTRPATYTDPRLLALLVMGKNGMPGFTEVLSRLHAGQTDFSSEPGGALYGLTSLPEYSEWQRSMRPEDFNQLMGLIAEYQVGTRRQASLGGHDPEELDRLTVSVLKSNGFDPDDRDWLTRKSMLLDSVAQWLEQSSVRRDKGEVWEYLQKALVRAEPEGYRPSFSERIFGRDETTRMDLPSDQRDFAVVPPPDELDDLQAARVAGILARQYGAVMTPDELRTLLETLQQSGLPLTIDNLAEAARYLRGR